MKFKLKEPKLFVNAIGAVSELVQDDVIVRFEKDSFNIVAMDPAQIAMVILRIDKSAFDNYEIVEPGVVGADMAFLSKLLGHVQGDELEFSVTTNKIILKCVGTSSRKFEVPLHVVNTEVRKKPTLEVHATAVVPVGLLTQAISDTSTVGDATNFDVSKEGIKVLGVGQLGKVETDWDSKVLKELNVVQPAKVGIANDYLNKVLKGGKLTDMVLMHFRTNYPLIMEFKVGTKISLGYIIAPRIENSE